MKYLAILLSLFLAVPAFSQTLSNGQNTSVASDSAAVNSGVSTTFNSYGTPLSIVNSAGSQQFRTNQAYSAPPSFSSPAVIGTCATAGFGVGIQAVGGGASLSAPGGVDAGCDLQRDLAILKAVDASVDVAKQRACAKPEIAKAYADAGTPCTTAAQKSARAEAVLNDQPVATAPRDPYISMSGRSWPSGFANK